MWGKLLIFWINSLLVAGGLEGESCQTYAGGSVYPHTSNLGQTDHKLQFTKTVISKSAPFWESTAVFDGKFIQLKSTDYLGKYLVFFFYPLDFTFVCPTEILAFSDRIEEFRKINTEVVACSVDSHFTHLAWINTPRKEGGLGKVNFPLLSDLNHSISKDYGVFLDDLGHTLRVSECLLHKQYNLQHRFCRRLECTKVKLDDMNAFLKKRFSDGELKSTKILTGCDVFFRTKEIDLVEFHICIPA